MVIRHAYTGWPGCTHDARVLRNSSLFEDGEQGNAIGQRNFIIADNAYPLRNWLSFHLGTQDTLLQGSTGLTGDFRVPGKYLNDATVILRGGFGG